MRHAELLRDPASIHRGDELIELYIEGFRNYQAIQHQDKKLKHHFHDHIDNIADQAISVAELHAEDYARIGKAVIDAKQEQIEIDAMQEAREKEGKDIHDIAFASAIDFLGCHAGNPIAAALLGKEFRGSIYAFVGREPKKVGGFIIPEIVGNARLHISGRPNSTRPKYQLQIFDTFKPPLKIAIGE